jgi:hypothetical protein
VASQAQAPPSPARGRLRAFLGDPVIVGATLLVVCRVAFWFLLPNATDDAYIAFRYALHLTQGRGLTFNPGEAVMGFTSLPWTLWCSVGILLLHDPVAWTRVSALLLDGVTLFCVARLLERHASRGSAWCFVVFFAAWPFFSAIAASGLEMSAMMALMAVAALAAGSRGGWAGVSLGLLALVRPEGILAAGILSWWASARARWIALAIFVIGIGSLTAIFGNPVPQSLLAKASLYGTPGPWKAHYWWDWLIPADLGDIPSQQETIQLWALRVLMIPAACAGLWHLRRRPGAGFGLACLAVLGVYIALGVAYFYWYFAVPALGIAYLAAAGLPRIVRGPWIYASVALLIAGNWTIAPERSYRARARVENRLFGEVGRFLAARGHSDETVFLEPLGMIGWDNPDLKMVDEVGLVAPAVARRRPQGPGWYVDVVESRHPEWLVVRYGFLLDTRAFAGAGAPFRDSTDVDRCFASYRVAYQTAAPPGPTDLIVFRRAP